MAIKANENNLTPFTLTMLGLPVSHDLTNLVYDTLFWSQVKADPEPWLADAGRAQRGPHPVDGEAAARASPGTTACPSPPRT